MKTKAAPQWIDWGIYKEPIPATDNIRMPRVEVDDANTYLDKDGSNNLTFTDVVAGTKTLTELVAGGGHTFDEIHLIPKASSTGAEGTMFYCSDDNSLYVATE